MIKSRTEKSKLENRLVELKNMRKNKQNENSEFSRKVITKKRKYKVITDEKEVIIKDKDKKRKTERK